MRVDFYILDTTEPADRLYFACRLTEKAYGLNSRVHAHADSEADARVFDQMLWTFRQGSFVPHELVTEVSDLRAPVSIGSGGQHPDQGELLVNLGGKPPEFAAKFARVAEIIGGDEASREAGRERFKHYRSLGIEPETHTIGGQARGHTMEDDEIPVLRDVVTRRNDGTAEQQLDQICDRVQSEVAALTDELLAEGLRHAEASLRQSIGDRLRDELPEIINAVLREQLGGNKK